jgi:RNA ligase partner protein
LARLQRLLRVYVLDTSAVTDPRLRGSIGGGSLDESVRVLGEMLGRARLEYGLEVYMPPSVYEEARRFLMANGVTLQSFQELATWITVKPPARHEVSIPATVFREIVDEFRQRITRGLRVAEDHVRRAFDAGASLGEAATREARRERLGAIIRGLRDRYREATRHGVVDSIEDIDAVLLAYELHAILVTNDEGVRRLAEALGVVTIDPTKFVSIIRGLLRRAEEKKTATTPAEEKEAGETLAETP